MHYQIYYWDLVHQVQILACLSVISILQPSSKRDYHSMANTHDMTLLLRRKYMMSKVVRWGKYAM